jgi:DNA-binding CsgD family transcriptional regulator
MDAATAGTAVVGDIVGSRRDAPAASSWLRTLRDALDSHYAEARLARFEYTQGDEIQGLLSPAADPFDAPLVAALHPGRIAMRWVVRFGPVDPGEGPATQRTGDVFVAARAAMARLDRGADRLHAATGEARSDRLLAALAPVLGEMLAELSDRQRDVARLLLLEGRRQSEAARVLGVAPPTVSISAQRGHLRSVARVREALRLVYQEGVMAATAVRPGSAAPLTSA